MTIDIAGQLMNFIRSFILGGIFFLLYDILRLIRSMFSCGFVLVFFQDILYFFTLVIATTVFMFAVNNGEVRIYLLSAILLGWVVLYATYGKLSRSISEKVCEKCKYSKKYCRKGLKNAEKSDIIS